MRRLNQEIKSVLDVVNHRNNLPPLEKSDKITLVSEAHKEKLEIVPDGYRDRRHSEFQFLQRWTV